MTNIPTFNGRRFKITAREYHKEFFDYDDDNEVVEERLFRICQRPRILKRLQQCGWVEWSENTLDLIQHWSGDLYRSPHILQQLEEDFYLSYNGELILFTTRHFDGCNLPFVCMIRGKTKQESIDNSEKHKPPHV